MGSYNDGEYIPLQYEDHPGWQVIKGWHDVEHCQQQLIREYGDDAEHVTKVEHHYGFWGMGFDECGERRQCFYERAEPGRGRFKVTLAYVSGYHAEVAI